MARRASPSKDVNLDRLCTAIGRARLAMRHFRVARRNAVVQYVGQHWSENAAEKKVPVNLLALYVQVVGRALVAKNPRYSLSTFDRAQKAAVHAAQTWMNKQVVDMDLADTLQRVVMDGLFSVGVCKVALATPADSARLSWDLDAGEPFAEPVDLDDFVYDVHARKFAEASFMGHRYRVPYDAVRDSKVYDRKPRERLSPQPDSPYNQEGDERISVMGRGPYTAGEEEFEDYVDLWEIYLPRHRLVVTLEADQGGGPCLPTGDEPLRVQNWLGPYCGPYHTLGFHTVPGNAFPKAPVHDLIDLHDFANEVFRKLMRQAQRQKEVLGIQGGAAEDGSRIMNADDGDIVKQDNPDRARVQAFGGPNQANLAIFQQTRDLYSWMAGNLDMMGGLSPQSKTLGQDQLLAANASKAVSDMQDSAVKFASKIGESLLWYYWHDPFRVMHATYTVPGAPELSIPQEVGPALRRRVPFDQLTCSVDPYSMQHSTPQSRLQLLLQVVQTMIFPALPILRASGVNLDINALLKKIADYGDMPDLGEVVTVQEPPEQTDSSAAGGGDDAPSMPAATTRTYERRSVGGATRYGKDVGALNAMNGQAGGTSEPGAGASAG